MIFVHTVGPGPIQSSLSDPRPFVLDGLEGRSRVTFVDVALGEASESGRGTLEGSGPVADPFKPFKFNGACIQVSQSMTARKGIEKTC